MSRHEPARLVGADRQDCEAERAIAISRRAEVVPVAIAEIANVIDAARRRLDDKRGPQRHVAVGQVTRRPVPRRTSVSARLSRSRRGDANHEASARPPSRTLMIVSLPSGAMTRGRCAACKPRQRRDIEMIVVTSETRTRSIGGSPRKAMPGSVTRSARPAEGRSALRPDRVDQNVEARDLEQNDACPT